MTLIGSAAASPQAKQALTGPEEVTTSVPHPSLINHPAVISNEPWQPGLPGASTPVERLVERLGGGEITQDGGWFVLRAVWLSTQ